MPKEKPSYRYNYEMLKERFPDKDLLTIKDIQQITGWGRNRILDNVPLNDRKWITIASLANYLAS